MASQGPVLKLLPCLSKENCLHIGLSWWGVKGIIGFRHRCSYCGYFKVWSTSEAVVKTDTPRVLPVWSPVLPGSKQSRRAHLCLQLQGCSFRQSCHPFTLDKSRNGSHSIICKVTCCLLSLFLLHILFVFKCFRQSKNKCKSKDAVKMNCLVFIISCVSSIAVNKQKTHVFNFF